MSINTACNIISRLKHRYFITILILYIFLGGIYMDFISIDKSNPCKINVDIDGHSSSNKKIDNAVASDDISKISGDGIISYKFLKRIEGSACNDNKISFIDKYVSEYEKIKKEIDSGTYGSDKEKYINILDSVFNSSLSHASSHIKMSAPSLIKCHKQYETATGLAWMFKAEHKRIKHEIEYYKKKKNHTMVASLRQLSDSYKHAIDNISNTAAMIEENIYESTDNEKSQDGNK